MEFQEMRALFVTRIRPADERLPRGNSRQFIIASPRRGRYFIARENPCETGITAIPLAEKRRPAREGVTSDAKMHSVLAECQIMLRKARKTKMFLMRQPSRIKTGSFEPRYLPYTATEKNEVHVYMHMRQRGSPKRLNA